ncbi:hypothetical protein LUZ60_011634 [Juncus effusus]|nr:hypothetical protein LUZ60_011634 [Juncus effusus]
MDPQAYVRLTVGSLGLRLPTRINSPCTCQIRLCGSESQALSVPLISSSAELNPDRQNEGSPTEAVFYLEESKLKEPGPSGCFRPSNGSFIEIIVYAIPMKNKTSKRQQIGVVRLEVGPGFGLRGKPVLLHNGWVAMRGCKNGELHLRVKVEPDPRYVFRFEDEMMLNPQVVQVQGSVVQPIFSCKFSSDRRRSAQMDEGMESEDTRKGWKVVVHDLSGSAVAAAFMDTPFVPSTGSDHVARSNPGAWLIVRPDPAGGPGSSWHPWARLEAWRENASITGQCHDSVCLRLRVLPDVELSEMHIRCDKGGEFLIDLDSEGGGYVMDCRIGGEEGKRGRIGTLMVLQLAVRHVTCVEDAAVFVALAAAVDLSVKACRRFCRKTMTRSSRDEL